MEYKHPQLSLSIITSVPKTNKNRTKVLSYYSMLMYSQHKACFEHSNFFKVNDLDPVSKPTKARYTLQKDDQTRWQHTSRRSGPARVKVRNPTTSFLTATTLIYATGAGITAAAGTRLALQLHSLRSLNCSHSNYQTERPGNVIYCHYLPVSGLGNLRACCLP